MSWTLLVSCNSFKLKINPENDHAIGGARLRITKYLKLPSSAKQCSTWSSDPAPKLGGWSLCGQSGCASRLECAKSGNHFRTPPSNVAWAAWGTTWNNLLQLEVSVFLCPGKMDDSIRRLLFLEWNSEIAQVVSPLRPTGSAENSELSWIIWIHLASLLLSVTSFAASVTSVARLLSGQDERSDAKRRRSDAKRRGWGREGSKDNAVIMRAAARRSALGLGAGRFPGIHIVLFYELEKIDGFSLKDRVFQDFPVYHLAPYQILDIA